MGNVVPTTPKSRSLNSNNESTNLIVQRTKKKTCGVEPPKDDSKCKKEDDGSSSDDENITCDEVSEKTDTSPKNVKSTKKDCKTNLPQERGSSASDSKTEKKVDPICGKREKERVCSSSKSPPIPIVALNKASKRVCATQAEPKPKGSTQKLKSVFKGASSLVGSGARSQPPDSMAGDYPAEYNAKVHGPYDPARYYGKPDTPFGQVKVSELGSWFGRRNKHPQALVAAVSRAYWRWQQKYILPKRSGAAPYLQFAAGSMIFFYYLNYFKIKYQYHYKYH